MPDNQETADEPLRLEVGTKVYDYFKKREGAITDIKILGLDQVRYFSITWSKPESVTYDYAIGTTTVLYQAYLDREELAELRKFKDTATPHLRAHMTCESCSAQDAEIIRKALDETAV